MFWEPRRLTPAAKVHRSGACVRLEGAHAAHAVLFWPLTFNIAPLPSYAGTQLLRIYLR